MTPHDDNVIRLTSYLAGVWGASRATRVPKKFLRACVDAEIMSKYAFGTLTSTIYPEFWKSVSWDVTKTFIPKFNYIPHL